MTEIRWYGQSAFKIVTPSGRVLLIDPWLHNPVNTDGAAQEAALDRVDLILITHGHFDHVGSAVALANKHRARLVSTLDTAMALVAHAGYPADLVSYETLGNTGGILPFFEGELEIMITPAYHSSHINPKEAGAGTDDRYHWAGNACGFVVMPQGGATIYHTGDTDLYAEMTYVGLGGPVDVMLACIGDHFTMGPERAAEATKLVDPRVVVPMHFGTFLPMMTGTPPKFKAALEARGLGDRYRELSVNEPAEF